MNCSIPLQKNIFDFSVNSTKISGGNFFHRIPIASISTSFPSKGNHKFQEISRLSPSKSTKMASLLSSGGFDVIDFLIIWPSPTYQIIPEYTRVKFTTLT